MILSTTFKILQKQSSISHLFNQNSLRYSSNISFQKNLPTIITVAITGDVHDKTRAVNVPLKPIEQVDQICGAFEAGARIAHVHVRDEQGMPTWRGDKYKEVLEGARKRCPEMILQFSTGNYAPTFEKRIECINLSPAMASLTPGSVNFKPSRPGEHTAKQYINSHQDIEALSKLMLEKKVKPDIAIFDTSMIYASSDLLKKGLLSLPLRFMFVMGGHMALEARQSLLKFMVSECIDIFGESNFTWTAVGVGWNHVNVIKWSLELGGHVRTGFEDTLMIQRGKFANSNAELVKSVAQLCKDNGGVLATPKQARKILGIE